MQSAPTVSKPKVPDASARTVRARVSAGHLIPLDTLPFAEGTEVSVTIEVAGTPRSKRSKLSVWNLGAPKTLTRRDYYEPKV